MYIYIYDSFLNQNKYSKILSQIETRITDLGMNGKISRLGLMKNVTDVVASEIKRGAKTIVAVGNDNTIQQIVSSMANTNIPLGIIPIDKRDNSIAKKLGIGFGEEACDVLSARRVESIDLGKINELYFLTHIAIGNKNIVIELEGRYFIEVNPKADIYIVNLPASDIEIPAEINLSPQDGILQLVVRDKTTKKLMFTGYQSGSVFSFHKLKIANAENSVIVNGSYNVGSPAIVEVGRKALKLIVGKNRNF